MENKHQKFFSELGVFKVLSEPVRKQFLSQASSFQRQKGESLCTPGQPAHSLFIIVSGWVKIFRETSDGVEAVLDVVTTGAYFGDDTIFSDGIYHVNAEVIERAEIITIPVALIKEQVDKDPAFARALLEHLSHKQQLKEHEVEHLAVQSAPQRIGCFLLRLSGATSRDTANFDLPYDKTLIAARLGMQPETFSRALTKLRDEAGVQIKGAKVSIEAVDQLSSYACSACSSEYPCRDLHRKKDDHK